MGIQVCMYSLVTYPTLSSTNQAQHSIKQTTKFRYTEMVPLGITVTFLFVIYQKSENSNEFITMASIWAQCKCLLALCSVTQISPAMGVSRLFLDGFRSPSTVKASWAVHRQCRKEHIVPVTLRLNILCPILSWQVLQYFKVLPASLLFIVSSLLPVSFSETMPLSSFYMITWTKNWGFFFLWICSP